MRMQILLPAALLANPVVAGGLRNFVYFTSWGVEKQNYKPQDLPTSSITHVLYAFVDINNSGSVISASPKADTKKVFSRELMHGAIGELYKLKRKNRNIKTLISIGGGSFSERGAFKFAATEKGRKTFAETAVKLATDWGMDGVDLDWEFPKDTTEGRNYLELLKETRHAFDKYTAKHKQNYHYLITVACSAKSYHYKLMDLKAMDRYIDSWNLMSYDYSGSWHSTSGHQANLYPDPSNKEATKSNTEAAINAYTAAGVAPDKIALGLPLYGRSFIDTDGAGKPYKNLGKSRSSYQYNELPRPGSVVTTDTKICAVSSYDPKTREFVSYDNVQTVEMKADYIKEKGLGGAFFWEASGDKKGSESLVGAMAKRLGGLDTSENMLDYPASQYENIRNSKA